MKQLNILFFLFFGLCVGLYPQAFSPNTPLSQDPKVIKNTLNNGFTYYIRQNKLPENKVELRLVLNAGSILETEKQQGLAHFLEHMSFNGSKSFPNAEMVTTLEKIGVRFGHELNAYTSFDETVYYLPIASDKVQVGLTVLEDWAMNLTLAEKEIDRERGVVIEELRLGRNASTRIREKYLPVLFDGSLYSYRLPIGKEEVIRDFSYNELRRFYKKWHRPDLMAIIVVGDVDPQSVEKEIISKFGAYPASKDKSPRPSNPIPDHDNTKVVIATDPESTGCSVEISYKHSPKKVGTQKEYLEQNLYHSLYSSMINARLNELLDSEEPPFSDAESGYSNYFREVDTYSSFARCTPAGVLTAFRALITEDERILRYGFLDSELERAKKKLLARVERWYNEREKTLSDKYADEYQLNFLKGDPIPGVEFEYGWLKEVLPTIGTNEINSLAPIYMTEKNRVILVTGTESETIAYPSEQTFLSVLDGIKKETIAPYEEGSVVKELISQLPPSGTIVSEKTIPEAGLVEWKLSNGATVVFKKTDFKNDQVLFRSTSEGGFSMLPTEDDMSALYATKIQDNSGVNGINNTQLKRLMAGKDISLTQSLVLYNESMSGRFSVQDREAFFQLLYLYHTAPYFSEGAFKRIMKDEYASSTHLLDSPENYFNYQVALIMNNGNPRRNPWPVKDNLDKVQFNKAESIYRSRFENAAQFTYVFVGNIDPDEVKPLVLTYIGGISGNDKTRQGVVEQNFEYPKGPASYLFKKGTEDKVNVSIRFTKKSEWDKGKEYGYNAFIEILNTRLFESLRREMSGVYGVRIFGKVDRNHESESSLSISFGTNKESYEKLYERAIQETKRLQKDGPTEEEVARIKEKRRVALATDVKANAWWVQNIFKAYRYGDAVDTEDGQTRLIESLSPEKIRQAAAEYLDMDSELKFLLLPESL